VDRIDWDPALVGAQVHPGLDRDHAVDRQAQNHGHAVDHQAGDRAGDHQAADRAGALPHAVADVAMGLLLLI